MANETPNLLSPIQVGDLHLPNRIIMAPLTRLRGTADHVPTPIMADYYAQRASAGLILSNQIDYLGGMPTTVPKPVKTSEKAEDMLRFDLDNETETIKNYRQRIKQAEALGHYALAELIRGILVQEQNHQHDLATALGIDVPKVFVEGA